MPFTRKALALVWLSVFGLFALAGSGAIVGANALWLVLAALITPPIILARSNRQFFLRQPAASEVATAELRDGPANPAQARRPAWRL
jgi:hypothetical protein